MATRCHVLPLAMLLVACIGTMAAASDRDRRCLALLAYAEAAGEGPAGMLAVMKVIRNRIADPHFADDACTVALEPGQFQPVAESPTLRRALGAPEGSNLAEALGATSRAARLQLVQAWRLAGAAPVWPARDPTGGAIYFVNPRLMDPAKCPWFAKLKRTAIIGAHVFMRHYTAGERPQRVALDCARVGKGSTKPVTTMAAE